jgi:pimeloyl-ACP methyl ester carboxylesterase
MLAQEGSTSAVVLRDVNIRGVRVRFLEAGAGPPIVLVHGFLASHAAWDGAIGALTSRFRVIAPDLPGFGDSEKPPPSRYAYGVSAFAETLVDLIAAEGVTRVAIVGQRLGATVALRTAIAYPDLVERLVLVSPELYPRPPSPWIRTATLPVMGGIVFKQLAGRRLFLRYFDPWTPPSLPLSGRMLDWIDSFEAPAAREAAHAAICSMSENRGLLARLSRATLPVLVCAGGRDDKVRLGEARRLARELPAARLELFDTRSAPEDERPEEFARRVIPFLLESQAAKA